MTDESHDTSNVSRRSPGTVCYVAALETTLRTPSPDPSIEESDDEDDYDPAFSLLLKESESLKETFQKESLAYGHLKYELRRAVAYFEHGISDFEGIWDLILNLVDIDYVTDSMVDELSAQRARTDRRQKDFFGSRVKRVRNIFKQLELLLETNNSLLDKLQVLHYPVEETKHITRRDKLVKSHNNLDFLIKDLCDEVSIMLSSSVVANFSE